MKTARRLTSLSLLVSLGIVLHIAENWFGLSSVVPGGKLGLANAVALVAMYMYGLRAGILVATLRSVLGGMLSGTFPGIGFFMGLSGAVVSVMAMGGLLKSRIQVFSAVGISIIGAMMNNFTQILIFSIVVGHISVFMYLPYLVLFAILAGFVVGFLALVLQGVLQKIDGFI